MEVEGKGNVLELKKSFLTHDSKEQTPLVPASLDRATEQRGDLL